MIRRRVTHGKHLICTAWTGVGHGQCMQYAWKGPNLSQAFRIWNIWRFFNKLTLLSSVYKLFNWQIWVVTQPYPVQISERDIHTIFTSINITQYWWWVSRWGPLIEALCTVLWSFTCQCRWKVQDKPSAWHPWKDLQHRGPSWGKERLFYDLKRMGHTVLSQELNDWHGGE